MKYLLTLKEYDSLKNNGSKVRALLQSKGFTITVEHGWRDGIPYSCTVLPKNGKVRAWLYEQDEREIVLAAMKQEL